MLDRIARGRTDLVFDFLAAGHPASAADATGVKLIVWCAYYGDVSALRLLLKHGETLQALGPNHDLNGAAFHGHWRLCQFLIEHGADVNLGLPDTGETPLHAATCAPNRLAGELVVEVLLAHGADPNRATHPGVETGCVMRDGRTKAETPLHRAAAFGTEPTIELLLRAGARVEARDMQGDTPLGWASWHARPDAILRPLCHGRFAIHPDRRPMEATLLGTPAGDRSPGPSLRASSLRPFVPSGKDYDASRRLFAELGFEELWETDGYAGFKNGGAQFILQRYDDATFASNYMVRLNVPDLDAWWAAVASRQLERTYPAFRARPPADFPWGREVNFIDLAGVCWHVGAD